MVVLYIDLFGLLKLMDLFLCNLSLLPKSDALWYLDFYITNDTSIASYVTRLFNA